MIVLTAPTGKIGSRLVNDLLAAGEPLRLIARDPAKLRQAGTGRAEVIHGAMNDPGVLDRALNGADALFWLVPSPYDAIDVREHYLDFTRPAAEAVHKHGVRRVVAVSGLYRGTDRPTGPGFGVNAMDAAFAEVGVAYRALWSANHMENLLRQVASIRQGFFSLPVDPEVKMPLVATRDVASVAKTLLAETGWTGQGGVPVVGPEDLSHDDMATIIAEAIDRRVSFRAVSETGFIASMEARGASHGVAQWLADMFAQCSSDPTGSLTTLPRQSTPTTFRRWCEDVLKPAVRLAS